MTVDIAQYEFSLPKTLFRIPPPGRLKATQLELEVLLPNWQPLASPQLAGPSDDGPPIHLPLTDRTLRIAIERFIASTPLDHRRIYQKAFRIPHIELTPPTPDTYELASNRQLDGAHFYAHPSGDLIQTSIACTYLELPQRGAPPPTRLCQHVFRWRDLRATLSYREFALRDWANHQARATRLFDESLRSTRSVEPRASRPEVNLDGVSLLFPEEYAGLVHQDPRSPLSATIFFRIEDGKLVPDAQGFYAAPQTDGILMSVSRANMSQPLKDLLSVWRRLWGLSEADFELSSSAGAAPLYVLKAMTPGRTTMHKSLHVDAPAAPETLIRCTDGSPRSVYCVHLFDRYGLRVQLMYRLQRIVWWASMQDHVSRLLDQSIRQ